MRHQDYQCILDAIEEKYTKLLANNLAGIYVHGSLALGCFNWDKSDIDYIVVVNTPLTHKEKQDILTETVSLNQRAPQKGLEMSVVLKKHCREFIHPTPYEIHFSAAHLKGWCDDPSGYCEKMKGVDADLAAHFTIINHRGIVLCGEEISSVFSKIDSNYYFDSIKQDVQTSKQDIFLEPVSTILNLCRVLAYKKNGSILSKREGGEWGRFHLPCEYRPIVEQALENYLSGSRDKTALTDSVAMRFCEDMLKMIF